MKRIFSPQRALLLLIFLGSFSSSSIASILRYQFSGNITSIDNNLANTLGVSAGNDLLSVILSFDSNAVDINSTTDQRGSYAVDLSFSLGNLSSSSQLAAYTSVLSPTSIVIGSSNYSATYNQFTANEFAMFFQVVQDPNFILTDKLPLTAFDPASFVTRNWFILGTYSGSNVQISGEVSNM